MNKFKIKDCVILDLVDRIVIFLYFIYNLLIFFFNIIKKKKKKKLVY